MYSSSTFEGRNAWRLLEEVTDQTMEQKDHQPAMHLVSVRDIRSDVGI